MVEYWSKNGLEAFGGNKRLPSPPPLPWQSNCFAFIAIVLKQLWLKLVLNFVYFVSVCSSYLGVQNKKVIKDNQMSASSTLTVADLMKLINSTLETLDAYSNSSINSNKTSTKVKSNFTITGNMTAAHDGRLGNAKGSWCASGDPEDGHHHLIVDLGMQNAPASRSVVTD